MVLINNDNVLGFFLSQGLFRKKDKRKSGGKTLLLVSNELNQTDCLAPSWFPSGSLMGIVVSLCSKFICWERCFFGREVLTSFCGIVGTRNLKLSFIFTYTVTCHLTLCSLFLLKNGFSIYERNHTSAAFFYKTPFLQNHLPTHSIFKKYLFIKSLTAHPPLQDCVGVVWSELTDNKRQQPKDSWLVYGKTWHHISPAEPHPL